MRSAAAIALAVAVSLFVCSDIGAQPAPRRVAIKSGETIELHQIYWVVNCRLVMIGLPEIAVLEGPPELALSIREEAVLPRVQGCANKVAGGTLLLTAKAIADKKEAPLTYRLDYKTKDGPRQTSHTFLVSLFP
jgi:uncharacterized lipoprotein YbaY